VGGLILLTLNLSDLLTTDDEIAGECSSLGKAPVMDTAPTYGIWIADSEASADDRSTAGEPPDIIVRTAGHTTGSDAFEIVRKLYPERAFVREISLRAKGIG